MTLSPDTHIAPISFEHDIQRLTDDFTGRDWIFKRIGEWLKNKSDRFFILTGEPGVGKSAIAAQLTKIDKNDIKAFHFCRTGDVETVRPGRILRSLAAQLGKNFPLYGQALANTIKPVHLRIEVNVKIESMTGSQLTGVYIKNLKESDPDNELDILIRAPLAELEKMYAQQQQKPPDAAVILIDSLDEAVTTTGDENIVRLLAKLSKSDLPAWVRFILTSRPEDRVMREFEPLKPYKLEKMSEDNLKDIRKYIDKRVEHTKFQEVLRKNQVKDEILSNKIVELSMGIFLYTEVLLNDIEAGQQPLDNLSALPKSIDEIYHNFLKRFTVDKWQKQYRSILALLTVTQEPLTKEQLQNFAGIGVQELRDDLGEVCQFLDVDKDEEGNETYAIFHQSLRDYLLDEKRNKHFWCDATKQNNLFVNYYKKDSQSWEEVDWTKADKYGLLYLPKHLDAAGREEDLYTLLTGSSNWMESKFKVFSSDLPYIEDLELAMNKFNDPLNSDEILTLTKLYTARLVVQQRANAYQDIDLKTLVWLGRKTEEALSYARLRTDPEQKLTSLMIIANALLDTNQSNAPVLDEAVKVAQEEIENNSSSIQSLRNLVIALIDVERLPEAEEISNKIRNDSFEKVEILGELAKALGKHENLKLAENITKKIEFPYSKFKALLYLGTTLANNKETEKAKRLFSEAEDLTEKIDKRLIVTALLNLAKALADNGYMEEARLVFSKVQKLANAIEDKNDEQRVEILRNLATTQAQCGGKFDDETQRVFDELQELAEGITENNWQKAQSLLYLANALANTGKVEESEAVFSEGIKVADTFEQGWEIAERLRKFADNLVSSGFTEKAKIYLLQARESIKDIQENRQRAEALRYLVTALAQNKFIDEAREAFNEAEELAPNIEQEQKGEDALSKWAVILNAAGFSRNVGAICSKDDKFEKAQKKMDLIRNLAEETVRKQAKALTQNVSLAQEEYNFSAIDMINRTQDLAEVRKIASSVMKSEEFNSSNLHVLVIDIAKVGKFSAARKVAYAIEDDSMQINTLRELATFVAWFGFFKEAFNILGFKNGLIQFLNNLANWIGASDIVEQKLSLKILQETTRIFGWTYPYWGRIYNQLVSSGNETDFPIWKNPATTVNKKEKEKLDSRNLHISNIFPTIPSEQAQRFEACIQEAVDILYQNIESRKLTTLTSIEKTVLKRIIQSISRKILSIT